MSRELTQKEKDRLCEAIQSNAVILTGMSIQQGNASYLGSGGWKEYIGSPYVESVKVEIDFSGDSERLEKDAKTLWAIGEGTFDMDISYDGSSMKKTRQPPTP